jgi:hypothetical protein
MAGATCVLFHRFGIDDTVRLEVTLPWLVHKFGQAVQCTIESGSP